MTNYSLYRKEIEVLEKIKQLYEQGQYISGYQESVTELFFENREHLLMDFLELIPVDNLESVKKLLYFLRTVSSSISNVNTMIRSNYAGVKSKSDVINEISDLQKLIQNKCNEKYHFGVFYSWQTDVDSKYNRNFIEKVLEKTIKEVNSYVKEGPFISIDKDTRGVSGSPDIVTTILQKIDRSICFVADVTPIIEKEEKKICNSNVMFELGYALNSLGYERVILICNIYYGDLKDLPFDLGLKRVIPYKYGPESSDIEKKAIKDKLVLSIKESIISILNI